MILPAPMTAETLTEMMLARMKERGLPGLRLHRRRGAVVLTAKTMKGKRPMTIDMLELSRSNARVEATRQRLIADFNLQRLEAATPSNDLPTAAETDKMRAALVEHGFKNADIAITKMQNGEFRIHIIPKQPKAAPKVVPLKKGARKGGKR